MAISTRLMGGIGNMMFQIAFLEYQAYKHGLESTYLNVEEHFDFLYSVRGEHPQQNHSAEFLCMFENFNWHKGITTPFTAKKTVKVPWGYHDIEIEDGVEYQGYFQSEKYFPDREFIGDLFLESMFSVRQLQKYDYLWLMDICSIHVRRANYVKLSHIHPPQEMSYYRKAMDYLDKPDKYLIFSDDLEWCKKNFIGDEFVFIDEKDYICLFLMSYCGSHIIANSSFSFWGAYLSGSDDVVAPRKGNWFSNQMDCSDIISNKWIRL